MNLLKTVFLSISNLFFPHLCVVCKNSLSIHEPGICTACLTALPYIPLENTPDPLLAELFWGKVKIEFISAYLYFSEHSPTRSLIHALKYENNIAVGKLLGSHYGISLKTHHSIIDIDFLVPVPLHPRKKRKRGYNQSEILVHALSQELNIPYCCKQLIKTQNTSSQTRKHKWERWKNAQEVYRCKNPNLFSGKHILLVDDVLTTGATLEACVQALQKNNDVKVSIATLAWANK